MKIKTWLYWFSLVLPVFDITTGIFKAISDIPDDVRKIRANREWIEQNFRYLNDDCHEDMSDEEFDEKYYGKSVYKNMKGKKKNG